MGLSAIHYEKAPCVRDAGTLECVVVGIVWMGLYKKKVIFILTILIPRVLYEHLLFEVKLFKCYYVNKL